MCIRDRVSTLLASWSCQHAAPSRWGSATLLQKGESPQRPRGPLPATANARVRSPPRRATWREERRRGDPPL
eukprot:161911-Alexandrium_andersonii.AAC.1